MPAEESGAPDVDQTQPEGDDGRMIPAERLREHLDRVIDELGLCGREVGVANHQTFNRSCGPRVTMKVRDNPNWKLFVEIRG